MQDMVTGLIPFLSALRFNKAALVRRSVLICLHTLAEQVPTFILFDSPNDETDSQQPIGLAGPKAIITRPKVKRTSATAQDVKELILWAQSPYIYIWSYYAK